MNKAIMWLIIVFGLLLVGCAQQDEQGPIIENAGTPAQEVVEIPETAAVEEADEGGGDAVEIEEELAGPEVFVPITVEEFGLTTLVPADWPEIEGDPLLKNAWGPGEYRFVAFHSVPGNDVPSAMAELLGLDLEELLEGPPEGDYWEEQIGNHDWGMYSVDNPEIGLGQSVSMTMQDGVIYIVSLFIEMDYRDAVQNAVLENFDIANEVALDEVEISEEATPEISEEETAEIAPILGIELLDTPWMLKMIADVDGQLQDTLVGVEITAVFKSEGRVTGTAGCNDYVSNYTLEGETMSISVPAMTRKNCDGPEGIMLQETNFVSNLTVVASHLIDGQELQLFDSEGNAILIFSTP